MVDRNKCTECLACAEACPSKSLDIFGELKSVADIMKVVETDSVFYARSGGGLTLGGGEPLSQGDFALSILKEAKLRRVNTSIETCGQTSWETLENCAKYLDTILYDIKCIDSKKHEKFTGVSNELILENFEKLCAAFPNTPKVVRTPVVPGFNDTQDDITQIMEFIKGKLGVKFEILPYHRMGQAKYEFLGREYPMAGVQPRDEKIAALKKMTQNWFAAN
jgi:pyruvate formate lyase activating enzyme